MRISAVVCWSLLVALVPSGGLAQSGKIIDLTYPFSKDSVYWPTAEQFSLRVDSAGPTEKGYYYAANTFGAAEHGGTHIDAPIHFAEGMPTVDQIDLSRLIAPGVLVDLADRVRDHSDYLISIRDLEDWESKHGRIPEGFIVLLRTGWGRHYGDAGKYLGTNQRGADAVSELHFPGLDPLAAGWLAERKVASVGLDTASIDYGQSQYFESHQILSRAGVPVFENVGNLDQLPAKGFRIAALPMKIAGGSGGPLRIVALIE